MLEAHPPWFSALCGGAGCTFPPLGRRRVWSGWSLGRAWRLCGQAKAAGSREGGYLPPHRRFLLPYHRDLTNTKPHTLTTGISSTNHAGGSAVGRRVGQGPVGGGQEQRQHGGRRGGESAGAGQRGERQEARYVRPARPLVYVCGWLDTIDRGGSWLQTARDETLFLPDPRPSLSSLHHPPPVIQFSREQLLALRRPSRLPAEMADIPGVISAEPLDPVWGGEGGVPRSRAWRRPARRWRRRPTRSERRTRSSRPSLRYVCVLECSTAQIHIILTFPTDRPTDRPANHPTTEPH